MANLKNSTVADGTIELPDHGSAPSPTAGALYANTTSLYWEDNDLVSGGGGGAADKSTAGNAIANSASTDAGPSQGYRMHSDASTTLGIIAKANTFMHGTFYNELVIAGDVEAPGLYIRGEGTDNSQSITEQGPTGHTLTVVNDTKYENTVALPWSTTSIFFDGTGDKITAAQHSDFQMLEAGDYNVELWVQHSDHAGTEVYIEFYEDASNFWQLQHVHGTGLQFSATTAAITNFSMTGTEIADTLWHHVAVVKSGVKYIMYLDGTEVATVTSGDIDTLAGTLQIGDSGAGSEAFQGYLAEIRLTKGMVRYTGNFTPAQGYLSARMASFAIDATTFHSTDSPRTLDIGSRDRLGEDTTGDGGHCQVIFDNNYTINSTSYMIPLTFRNTSGHEFSLNYNIWPRALANTYMATSGAVFSASAYYGNRGIWFGGQDPSTSDRIQYFTIGTVSETTQDFHELSSAGNTGGAVSNGSRIAVTIGAADTNVIDFVTVATTGAVTDFGDLMISGQDGMGEMSDGSRGLFGGGFTTPPDTHYNNIQYITISTTGNARDFGDFQSTLWEAGLSNGSRGIASKTDVMEYITIGTLGNSINFGELTASYGSIHGHGGSDGSRGVIVGGTNPTPAYDDHIDYFNIGVISNSADFSGELTQARGYGAMVTNGSRALLGGGQNPSYVDTCDYFPIGVTGTDAVDFGELAAASRRLTAASGD